MTTMIARRLALLILLAPVLALRSMDYDTLSRLQDNLNPIKYAPATAEWIIGYDDPNQVVEVTAPMRYDGDIIIVNNGRLLVKNTAFTLNGDLTMIGTAQAQFLNSELYIVQNYSYEHQAIVAEASALILDNVDFSSSGESWSVGAGGHGLYRLSNSRITNGFITTTVLDSARIEVEHADTAGEFLCMGENKATITHSDFVIFWLVLPDSAHVDRALPQQGEIDNWHFPGPDDQGIPYTVTIDSCTQVLWGLISQTGSEAVFRDTHFRVIGLYFDSPDSLAITGVVNGSTHDNDVIQASDRTLRLINSRVDTWNFYAASHAKLNVENCIFGEALSMDSSQVTIINSICDGSGGYIGAIDNSVLTFWGAQIRSQVTSRHKAVLISAASSIMNPHVDADEQSIMLIANTSYLAPLRAHASASIFEAQLPPVEGAVDSEVPVYGTARLLTGPDSPLDFRGYRVDYKAVNGDWMPMHQKQAAPVLDDLLATWQTFQLRPGSYDLRLCLFHNFDDSVAIESNARLKSNVKVTQPSAGAFQNRLLQNSPNPFNPMTSISFEVAQAGPVQLTIYNSLGQIYRNETIDVAHAGIHQRLVDASGWPAGTYFCRLKANDFTAIKQMTLIK